MATPRRRHTGCALVAALAIAADAAAAPGAVDGVALARGLGFDDAALRRVMAGELVTRRALETTDKELALVVWGWTRNPVGLLFERLNADEVLQVDRTVRAYGEIDPRDPEAAFRALALPAGLVDELHHTNRNGPLHLSHDELRAISRARDAGGDAVAEAYRRALTERTSAYLAGGLDAVAPYARGNAEARPGEELRSATRGYRALREQVPDFYDAWAEFPRRPDSTWDLIDRYFWILQDIEGQPAVVLSHALAGLRAGRVLVAERQFYVGRAYNVSETVWGGLPAETGTFVYYHNRTSTDRVTGAGASVRKTIGRRMMQTEVLRFLESLREAFD